MNTTDKRNTKKNINWTKLLCIKIDLSVVFFFWFVTVVWSSNSRNKQKINTFTRDSTDLTGVICSMWSNIHFLSLLFRPWLDLFLAIETETFHLIVLYIFLPSIILLHIGISTIAIECTLRIWFSWYDLLLLNTFHWLDHHFFNHLQLNGEINTTHKISNRVFNLLW